VFQAIRDRIAQGAGASRAIRHRTPSGARALCAIRNRIASCSRAPPTYRAVPDFDLLLFNRTKKHVYFASQSFDDVNEGFDVDLGAHPGTDDGDEFEILLGWLPNGSYGECSDNDGKEPIAWAGWAWVP
jgi:hypothetical protein